MILGRIPESYQILDNLRLPHGLYLASPSTDYSYVWLRDSFYMSLPYLDKNDGKYEATYHRILDMFREYEWKIDIHMKQKPVEQWEYIHSRYSAHDVKEMDAPWGHAQHDAIGAILWGIGQGLKHGKKMFRDVHDRLIVQKLVFYLRCCEYHKDTDNGMWEEWKERHMSSVAACVAGLFAVQPYVHVPSDMLSDGMSVISEMFPCESATRPVDLAQLSLIYPYNLLSKERAEEIIARVEKELLRARGVARYPGDSYYSTKESDGRHLPLEHFYGTEAEWTFGLPWLALCHMQLGNYKKADTYIQWTEDVMLKDGVLPELYYAGTNQPNPNTPLGWCSALYILAKEMHSNY